MRLSTDVIKKIAERNLEMLFAKDTFQITFRTAKDDPDGSIQIMRIEPTEDINDPTIVSWCWIEVELQQWKRIPSYAYSPVRAVQMMSHFFTDSYIDIAKCIKCIVDKINEISQNKREVFYIDDDCIVLGFSEIGIDHADGSRDIIVNRDGVYSLIRFDKGEPITTEITVEQIREIIYAVSDVTSTEDKLEFVGADTIMFVDMEEYEEYDE